MSGADEIDAIIARVRAIPGLARRAAPDAARAVERVLGEQLERGESPTGETWAPRRADGGRALEDARKALAVAPIGTRLFARLTGPVARHDLGRARGGVVRKMLPASGPIPAALAKAIRDVLTTHFERATKGGR